MVLEEFEAAIITNNNKIFRSESPSFHGEITIFEVLGSSNTIRKIVLFNERTSLNVKEGLFVILSEPIFIRPEHKYEIQIKIEDLSSEYSWCSDFPLKDVVRINPGIIVRFYNDSIIDNERKGLIDTLWFYEI